MADFIKQVQPKSFIAFSIKKSIQEFS